MPNTANSSWNYDTKTTAPTPATGNYTLKATNKDTVIGSRTYRVYTNSGGQNEYYAQVGSDYYQYTTAAGLSTQAVEVLYLKDAAAGTTWSETQSITMNNIPISTTLNYQIAEKGISYTTNGKTYTDVTHVKVTLGAFTLPFPIPITQTSDIHFYYARGIGRIYNHTKITVAAALLMLNLSIDNELLLKTYTIQ
ncbi:MAG: hypothetical protein EOO61_15450 [Hymenobacter sp.]|nr:MAG: hypothetical protein EOO61_15450 [Hymenobacter sp.]